MRIETIRSVTFLGAGNVAWQLCLAFKRTGVRITQIYNRTYENGITLARKAGSSYIGSVEQLTTSADIYFISVSDDAIKELAVKFPFRDKLLVHTSGSTPLSALSELKQRAGVFYPVQTFSGRREINFRKIPVCIEAGCKEDQTLLLSLASGISGTVLDVDSPRREILHAGAVFAGNFTNFMYVIAEDLLKENGLPPELLHPLVRKTAGNITQGNAFLRQTGPAVRRDRKILDRHRQILASNKNYLELYDLISRCIMSYKRKQDEL